MVPKMPSMLAEVQGVEGRSSSQVLALGWLRLEPLSTSLSKCECSSTEIVHRAFSFPYPNCGLVLQGTNVAAKDLSFLDHCSMSLNFEKVLLILHYGNRCSVDLAQNAWVKLNEVCTSAFRQSFLPRPQTLVDPVAVVAKKLLGSDHQRLLCCPNPLSLRKAAKAAERAEKKKVGHGTRIQALDFDPYPKGSVVQDLHLEWGPALGTSRLQIDTWNMVWCSKCSLQQEHLQL